MQTTQVPAPDFVRDLAAHGDRLAVLTAGVELRYDELAARVQQTAARLGGGRRLVLVAGANDLEVLVAYLAALHAGHVVLLAPGDRSGGLTQLRETYRPDTVVRAGQSGCRIDVLREAPAHDLHPDLALLLTTSGSTGSPKLVRLSRASLDANAEQVAATLGVRASDRAATTLPLHYCYGLSVLHSHLLRGAAVVLTDLSVVDACFWELFRERRCTTLAAVPYTFELLERVGFAERDDLPSLRSVLQAGGRLAPERVQRWAEVGRSRGWDLFVMYGQTEATARMAVLPPDLAREHPHTVGRPVPGGAFRIDPVPESGAPGVGELVYTGPNVMLGYAEGPADLALGQVVTELRTGDLARRTEAGLYELVGRRGRVAKLFGTRLDLQHLEQVLAASGHAAACVEAGEQLVVAVEGSASPAQVSRLVRRTCGLPPRAVRVVAVAALPRSASGKVDLPAVRALGTPVAAAAGSDDLRALFAEVLDRPDVTDDDTFVGLGGDSLSYVEMSLRLEQTLGRLPASWHTTRLGDLRPAPSGDGAPAQQPARRRPGRAVETGVLLRALAIVLIVATHANALTVVGGAHVLLGVAGFNFARFQLAAPIAERARRLARSTARVVVPTVAWVAGAAALTAEYGLQNVLLLNHVLGTREWSSGWHYWFVEALVCLLVLLGLLLAVPAVDRAERAAPFAFAAGLVGVGMLLRSDLVGLDLGPDGIHTAQAVLWLFALGWAAARARTAWHRLALTAALVLTVPGFADDAQREAVVLAGMLLLVWVPSVRVPALVARLLAPLAAASLYVYVTHWQVYPHLEVDHPWLATLASFGVGIAYWRLVEALSPRLRWPRLALPRRSGIVWSPPAVALEAAVQNRE